MARLLRSLLEGMAGRPSMAVMRSILGMACLWLVCVPATAGQETEATGKWAGDVSLGLSYARGNTDSTQLSLGLSARKDLSAKVEWQVKGVCLWGRTDAETTAESLDLSTRSNWQHSKRVYSFYELAALRDRFKDYGLRFAPAAGGAYRILALEPLELAFEAGVSGVWTRYETSDVVDSYLGFMAGNQLVWKLSPTAELTQSASINADVGDPSRFLFRFEASLAAALAREWALKFTLRDSYDNKPLKAAVKKNDVVFIAGLSAMF